MADPAPPTDVPKRRKGLLLPLLIGVVLAVAGAAGGFWAVTSGPFAAAPPDAAAADSQPPAAPYVPPVVAFVPLETLVVSLGPDESSRHLMFTAELEVDPAHAAEVAHLSPRVLDVLNSYLRVVSVAELGDPTSLGRLRAQMLRRIQIVTGTGRVHDLLVTQFVVN
jgi:flagellar protein FliL